jgi:hypothetical protein
MTPAVKFAAAFFALIASAGLAVAQDGLRTASHIDSLFQITQADALELTRTDA